MDCTLIKLYYNAASAVSASYQNCGDLTPMSYVGTGTPLALATQIYGNSLSLNVASGSAVLVSTVGGYSYNYIGWANYVAVEPVSALLPYQVQFPSGQGD